MKKITLFLMSLFLTVGAMAQIQKSTSVENPENAYAISSAAGHYMSSCTGATKYCFGRFAFYEDGDNFKIYSIDAEKWVSYTKAESYSGGANKVVLVDNEETAEPWSVTEKDDFYNIAPLKTDGNPDAQYWNFHGGAAASGKPYVYDATDKTVGLYSDANDGGSKWKLELVELATEDEINAAKAIIVLGVGYPKTTSLEYIALSKMCVGITTKKHVELAKNGYKVSSDVALPEDGKAYTFTNVMNDENETKRYMKYVNGQKLGVSTNVDDASVFVCKKLRDGVYAFVTEDGKILTWVGNNEGGAYKENDKIYGYSSYYATMYNNNADWNEITVKKNSVDENQFGFLRLVARRKSGAVSSFIVNEGNRFDQAGDNDIFTAQNSSAWIVTEVEEYTNADAQNVAIAKITAKEAYKNHLFGPNLGEYYLNGEEKLYDKVEIISLLDAQETAEAVYALEVKLNAPEAGKYYRIMAVEGWNDDARYLGSQNSTAKEGRAEFVADANDNTVFYFDGTQLKSNATGYYLVNNNNFLGYNGEQETGSIIAFHPASNNLSPAFNISFNNGTRWLYCNKNNYTDGGGSTDSQDGYCFNIVEVTVTVEPENPEPENPDSENPDSENPTAVEEVETGNEKVEIYDLTGRKVENITKAGIYIVNGNKVLVK